MEPINPNFQTSVITTDTPITTTTSTAPGTVTTTTVERTVTDIIAPDTQNLNMKPIPKSHEKKEKHHHFVPPISSVPTSKPAYTTGLPPTAPIPGPTHMSTPAHHHNTTAHVADVSHDPRPLLKVDNEVHDFEVHREGSYAKGHTFPTKKHAGIHETSRDTVPGHNQISSGRTGVFAGTNLAAGAPPSAAPVTSPWAVPVGVVPQTGLNANPLPSSTPQSNLAAAGVPLSPVAPADVIGAKSIPGARVPVYREGLVGSQVTEVAPGSVQVSDPRPVLPLEREIHDYEVHREGRHAAGHTRPGAKPEGTYVGALPASVYVKGNTTDVVVNPTTPVNTGAVPNTSSSFGANRAAF